jgi:UDP:flavonoid glycosyltransferase YjiC (YdhE family)
VHLTLGTVFHDAPEVLARAIAGLRQLAVNLIVTVGPDADPARFGPQPAQVRIERYLPHALLLPRCELVVSQGGAGVMFGALSHGLPQLVIPQGADQFMNAEACRDSGAALALAPEAVSADAIAAAAERLLAEPGFGVAARGVQSQIEAMPEAEAVLATLLQGTGHIGRAGWAD